MSLRAELPARPPMVHPEAFIAPGAIVVGDVRIGARASVWFQAVLRGDSDRIEVGERSNIQDLTLVHMDEGFPALIGNRVTIGHSAIIHGCVIEDDCLIGMGAILLSGSRIGAGSLVGAGALVRERQVIPPNSLVIGSPARVAGEVQPVHREAIVRGCEHYELLARSYAAAGLEGEAAGALRMPRLDVVSPGMAGELEWDRWLGILEATPGWARERFTEAGEARWGTASAAGEPSAQAALRERIEAERAHDWPALEAALGASVRATPPPVAAGPAGAIAEWAAAREALTRRLRLLPPETWMPGTPRDIALPAISHTVRMAAARDLAARRAVLRALVQA